MKPVYFPFTYVTDPVAQALAACFGQFIVYQPLAGKIPEMMSPWIEKGILDVRVPEAEDQKELETMVKNYQSWADLHIVRPGSRPSLIQTWKDAVPFFASSSSSQVMADVKEQVRGESTARGTMSVSADIIFLYFAQEFDRHNDEITLDIKQYRQKEAELMRDLKMEDDSLTAEFQKEAALNPDDSAGYMLMERLDAWTRILLRDIDLSGIFITHLPAVMQELLDRTPTVEKLLQVESIPTNPVLTAEHASWQKKLRSALSYIVDHKWPPATGRQVVCPDFPAAANTVSLSIYLIPDQMPRKYFSHCTRIESPGNVGYSSEDQMKNTVVGLIEF